jgi:hypothetical protein
MFQRGKCVNVNISIYLKMCDSEEPSGHHQNIFKGRKPEELLTNVCLRGSRLIAPEPSG